MLYLQGFCGNLTPRDHEHDNTRGHYIDGTERIGTKQAFLRKGYEIDSGFYDHYAGETIEESLIRLAGKIGRP